MNPILVRNTAYARVWTVHTEIVTPAQLADALFERGFVPGVVVEDGAAPLSDAGLAEVRFEPGAAPLRFLSLSSSRGDGCRVSAARLPDGGDPLPDVPLARANVRHPAVFYRVDANGPSNSDRSLCENLAEVLLDLTNGVVEVGGRGPRGNKPVLYARRWLGGIKTT
jgi:hypothetical protein